MVSVSSSCTNRRSTVVMYASLSAEDREDGVSFSVVDGRSPAFSWSSGNPLVSAELEEEAAGKWDFVFLMHAKRDSP